MDTELTRNEQDIIQVQYKLCNIKTKIKDMKEMLMHTFSNTFSNERSLKVQY